MYDKKELEKFNSPRYRLTHQGRNYRSYIDLQTGVCYYVHCHNPNWNSNARYSYMQSAAQESDRALAEYMKLRIGSTGIEKNQPNSTGNLSTILNRYDDIIQLIVGVTLGGDLPRRIFGAHTFLIYNEDPYGLLGIWRNDVMLDASGSYGLGTFKWRDVIGIILPLLLKHLASMLIGFIGSGIMVEN